jgi:2-polyprenyl-3-methyl-5-hydroxy-6-metoxy-1,4-benzoquinol methylase
MNASKEHWNNVYTKNPHEKLGWFENDLSPSLKLINKTQIDPSARILNVGAGSTVLIDHLLDIGFENIIATDISEVSLQNLNSRIDSNKVEYIIDDLTKPQYLNKLEPIDLWIDRAVLHFLTEPADQTTYFELLKKVIAPNGFVIIAEFNLEGAMKCSGLDVCRYNTEMIADKLGHDFKLIEDFNYTYNMPSGNTRAYIYTLFQKV